MIEFRCVKCGKKLGMLKGIAEIKCPRCKKINKLNTEQQKDCRLA